MKENPFEKFLEKATYMAFLIPKKTHAVKNDSFSSFHIPSFNFFNKISKGQNFKPLIARPLCSEIQKKKLNELLYTSNAVKISLKEKGESLGLNTYNIAKQTNSIGKNRNLHLLSYVILYYERRFSNRFENRTWKLPKLQQISKFRPILEFKNQKFVSSGLPLSTKKINTISKTTKNGNAQVADDNAVTLEKQFSRRRNYRTSSPLHT